MSGEKKFLDLEGLTEYNQKLNTKLEEKFVQQEEGKVLSSNDFTDKYKTMIEDLAYTPISISSFTNSVTTAEMGSTVADVTLNWSLNKDPVSQKIDSETLDTALRTKQFTGQEIKADKSWTLSATDEREKTVTKTTKITFLNGVYWGVAESGAAFDSAFILSLSKALQATRSKTFTVNADAAKHIYFAIPTRYGTPNFNVGGFDGGFEKAATIEFTNASGYMENYDVYKSTNAGLGSTKVVVS